MDPKIVDSMILPENRFQAEQNPNCPDGKARWSRLLLIRISSRSKDKDPVLRPIRKPTAFGGGFWQKSDLRPSTKLLRETNLMHEDTSVATKHRFVCHTYIILMCLFVAPLLILISFKVVFEYLRVGGFDPKREKPYASVICLTVTLVVVCILSCGFESWRRYSPANLVLVSLFALFASLTVGFAGVYFPMLHLCTIYLVTLVCAVLLVAIFFTCCQRRVQVDSTAGVSVISCLSIPLLVAATATLVLTYEPMQSEMTGEKVHGKEDLLWLTVPAGIAILYVAVLVLDTRLILTGAWSIHPREHTFAAITLFVNMIVFIFLICRMCAPWRYQTAPVAGSVIQRKTTMSTVQVRPISAKKHIHDQRCHHDNVSSTERSA